MADCVIIELLSDGLPCPKTSFTKRERLCLFLAEQAGCCSGEGGREQHVDRACPNVPWQGLSPVQWWAASSGIPSPSALPLMSTCLQYHVSTALLVWVATRSRSSRLAGSTMCLWPFLFDQIFTCVGCYQMHAIATWQSVPLCACNL